MFGTRVDAFFAVGKANKIDFGLGYESRISWEAYSTPRPHSWWKSARPPPPTVIIAAATEIFSQTLVAHPYSSVWVQSAYYPLQNGKFVTISDPVRFLTTRQFDFSRPQPVVIEWSVLFVARVCFAVAHCKKIVTTMTNVRQCLMNGEICHLRITVWLTTYYGPWTFICSHVCPYPSMQTHQKILGVTEPKSTKFLPDVYKV